MSYRSLMVHLNLEHSNEAALRACVELAAHFTAEVIGVTAGFPEPPVQADGMVATSVLEADYERLQQDIAQCESRFRKAVAALDKPVQWRSDLANPARFLAAEARAADLVIAGRHPADSILVPHQSLDIGDAIMRIGRPMMLVPAGQTCLSFHRVLVAWKDTAEAQRAVVAAMPLLKRAKTVEIVELFAEGEKRDAERRIADVAAWLRQHGVTASVTAELSTGDAGSQLDLLATQRGIDVIVAGAYGHSRLREWAFGGMTRHLIYRVGVCTLLMH